MNGNGGKGQILYISHGGGPLPLLGDEGHDKMVRFLKGLPAVLRRPDEILVLSAHWEEAVPTLIEAERPSLYYDYYGFPEESYAFEYPAAGNPELERTIRRLLQEQSIDCGSDKRRGLDHGVFIPLMLLYPDAPVPVTQLSLVRGLDPREHLELGRALRGLLERNILIIGSGFSFHNMARFLMGGRESADPENDSFQDWLIEVCAGTDNEQDRLKTLEEWEKAPGARYCHPREEHLLPLHVCAGLAASPGRVVFDDYILGKRSVAFAWGV